MPRVVYIEANGDAHEVDVPLGTSVMEGAKQNGVDGIDADCGGVGACATCHVYVDEAWRAATGEPGDNEEELLDCATARAPNSRLSCHIAMTDALDGLVVRLPETQR